MTVITDIFYKD